MRLTVSRGLTRNPVHDYRTRARSDDRARLNRPVLRDHDDSVADEVAVAIGVLDPLLVDEPGTVPNARVLVDDHAVQNDVAADPEARVVSPRRRLVIDLVIVGAEEH